MANLSPTLVACWHRNRWRWRLFWNILHTCNRRCELGRLVRWAEQRKLPGPLRLYRARLADEEARLVRYTLRSPALAIWARRLHALNNLISPTPRYPARGSAAGYRYGQSRSRVNKVKRYYYM